MMNYTPNNRGVFNKWLIIRLFTALLYNRTALYLYVGLQTNPPSIIDSHVVTLAKVIHSKYIV